MCECNVYRKEGMLKERIVSRLYQVLCFKYNQIFGLPGPFCVTCIRQPLPQSQNPTKKIPPRDERCSLEQKQRSKTTAFTSNLTYVNDLVGGGSFSVYWHTAGWNALRVPWSVLQL